MVGNRLKALRDSHSLSQQEIATALGTTQSSINRYELDKVAPPLKVLMWYADYFDVSMDYIFNRTDKPEGKLFDNTPKTLQEKAKSEEDWNKFIEMCFDPNTDANARLKKMLVNMMKGDAK